mgnify:CR=1 FL=1
MLKIIVIIFPSIVSVGIYNHLKNKKATWFELLIHYSSFLLSNLIFMSGLLYFRGQSLLVIDNNMNNIGFLFKYLVFTCFFAVFLPIAVYYISTLDIKIKVIKSK